MALVLVGFLLNVVHWAPRKMSANDRRLREHHINDGMGGFSNTMLTAIYCPDGTLTGALHTLMSRFLPPARLARLICFASEVALMP
jgi:hypothetical protein